MQIHDKKKFAVRTIEMLVIIVTIILTILSINYTNRLRVYRTYGGEYLVPFVGLIILLIIEITYEELEERKSHND